MPRPICEYRYQYKETASSLTILETGTTPIMGQIITILNDCLGQGPEQGQNSSRGSSNNPAYDQLKLYNSLVEKFDAAMTYHMLSDKCSGHRFHKNDLCMTCMRLAIEADIENGHCQPGGPYGFTRLGFNAGFNAKTYYDEDYPEPAMSPRCAMHLPTLKDRQQQYRRCSGQSPQCSRTSPN